MICPLDVDPFNPTALRTAKTLWSFDSSECSRVKRNLTAISEDPNQTAYKVALIRVCSVW